MSATTPESLSRPGFPAVASRTVHQNLLDDKNSVPSIHHEVMDPCTSLAMETRVSTSCPVLSRQHQRTDRHHVPVVRRPSSRSLRLGRKCRENVRKEGHSREDVDVRDELDFRHVAKTKSRKPEIQGRFSSSTRPSAQNS